jgi:LPXTG-motif cell wall-anchored protein
MRQSFKVLSLAVLALAVAVPAFASVVPEIDPGTAVSGLSLLVGGVLVLRGRRRK